MCIWNRNAGLSISKLPLSLTATNYIRVFYIIDVMKRIAA